MTSGLGYRNLHQDVLRGIPVSLETTTEFTIPEAVVDTEVTANSGFPLQIRIGKYLTR